LSRVEDPEENRAAAARAIQQPTPFDSPLEARASETTHQPPRPPEGQVEADDLAVAPELKPLNALFGLTGRVAATTAFLAIAVLLFVIIMPGFRRVDNASTFSADVQRFTAALSRQPERQPSDGDAAKATVVAPAKPAIAQFQSLIASSGEPAAQAERSDTILRRFMLWRQKTNSAGNAQ
jgi:hypothetical protein